MNSRNLGSLILPIVIVAISGCASHQSGCMFGIEGNITAKKGPPSTSSGYCATQITYSNTSDKIVMPQIRATFFDANGNTITNTTYTFSRITPGHSQTINQPVDCNNQQIKKMHVDSAEATNQCYQETCLKICGVHNTDSNWSE